ncbi:MAG: haloacid dehalogenase type II [Alphaproteobacteria bacterium]|nr:haloacid dehalogenase type II [Alphaproteobacteria bacterium]|tara:strand:- start:1815 stop:2504 length:690 start_codon:yes stop_codon:yes gene_type:complete
MSAESFNDIGACVFDAYGTLFDVNAAAAHCQEELGDRWQPLAEMWRLKQLQYTWLRGLMGRHTDFWQVTGDALDYAMESLGLSDNALREWLMDLYLSLDAYPEVKNVLTTLKSSGFKTAILSNGSPKMLDAAVANAGIGDVLDAILTVEDVGVFKPHPSVYQMGVDHLGLPADQMSFQSSNAWDAAAASAFGYRVVWINRFGQARERIPEPPHAEITTLDGLPTIVGAA